MFFQWSLETQNHKQLVEDPQEILAKYVYNSWRFFQLLWLFIEAFRISKFIWQNIFDHF